MDVEVDVFEDIILRSRVFHGAVLQDVDVLAGFVGGLDADGNLPALLRLLLDLHLGDHLLPDLVGAHEPLVVAHLVGYRLLGALVLAVLEVLLLHAVEVDHLLHDEVGVVPSVLAGLAVLNLHHLGGHLVQEVTVVGDHQEGAVRLEDVILQPLDSVDVEVGGGLVHDEDVALLRLHDDAGQHHLGPLASGEGVHVAVHEVLVQTHLGQCVQQCFLVADVGALELEFELGVFRRDGVPVEVLTRCHELVDLVHAVLDVLDVAVGSSQDFPDGDVTAFGELFQIADAIGLLLDLAGVVGFDSQEDLDEGGLPRTVESDETDRVMLVDLYVGVDEHLLGTEGLGDGFGSEQHDNT